MRGKLSANMCEYKGKSLASVGVMDIVCESKEKYVCVCVHTGRCCGVSFSVWIAARMCVSE